MGTCLDQAWHGCQDDGSSSRNLLLGSGLAASGNADPQTRLSDNVNSFIDPLLHVGMVGTVSVAHA